MNKQKVQTTHKTPRTLRQMEVLKRQYAVLKGEGMLQRDIAKRLGVSVNTITDWKKSLPISHYFTIRAGMQKRLISMTKDESTPALDIYNLANALTAIDKIINRYTNPIEKRIKSVLR